MPEGSVLVMPVSANQRARKRENRRKKNIEERLNSKNELGTSDPVPRDAVNQIMTGGVVKLVNTYHVG